MDVPVYIQTYLEFPGKAMKKIYKPFLYILGADVTSFCSKHSFGQGGSPQAVSLHN